jgi:hypothetical protein
MYRSTLSWHERVPGNHWKGGTVGPYWDSNSDHSVVELVASRYTDCVTVAPRINEPVFKI